VLTYALVTPARNERANLERLAAAVAGQTLRPERWVIVVDVSDDGTEALAEDLARTYPWIQAVAYEEAEPGALVNGRREGRALTSFRFGVRALSSLPDVVVKQDADTSFEPDYFERLLGRFADDPRLGIAGGACYELERGQWVRRTVMPTHPRGASRAYRRESLDCVMTLEPRMGWDGLDEAKAVLAGYRTRTVAELGFRHHRATGGREGSRLRHGAAQGRASWYMGYRPSYLILRTLYRLPRDRSAAGMVWGYLAAAAAREPRCPEPDVVRHVREHQRLRRMLPRGAPS
jgi:glycosyltransferase involved in cell wall biosynthesis